MDNFSAITTEVLKGQIHKTTLIIKAKFPELSKFLDDTSETIPNQNHAGITLHELSEYYQSLNDVLTKYQLEHPEL